MEVSWGSDVTCIVDRVTASDPGKKSLSPVGIDNNPGKARWCDVHKRLECTKNRSHNRGECHGPAIRGINACKNHAGISVVKARAVGNVAITTAWRAARETKEPVPAGNAAFQMLQVAWLRTAIYGELLRRQVAAEGGEAGDPEEEDNPQSSGLIGYRYGAAGKDGKIYVQSEEVRALVALEAQERDRVVKYAKVAHDMGINDRMTAIAERWTDVVISRMTAMLDALGLTREQSARVPELVQSYLGTIDIDVMNSIGS